MQNHKLCCDTDLCIVNRFEEILLKQMNIVGKHAIPIILANHRDGNILLLFDLKEKPKQNPDSW